MLTDYVRDALRTGRFEQLDLGALYLDAVDSAGASAYPSNAAPPPPPNRFLGAPTLALAEFVADCQVRLADALRRRGIERAFSGRALDAATFATLLQLALGETGDGGEAAADASRAELGAPAAGVRRPYPSAGGIYPIEGYVLVKTVERIPEGHYYYSPTGHALHCVRSCVVDLQAFFGEPARAAAGGDLLDRVAAALVLVADVGRSLPHVGERAWKLALLEAGHVAQNVELVAAGLSGVGVCAPGGCASDALAAALHLDPRTQRVVYPLLVGATGDEPVDASP